MIIITHLSSVPHSVSNASGRSDSQPHKFLQVLQFLFIDRNGGPGD